MADDDDYDDEDELDEEDEEDDEDDEEEDEDDEDDEEDEEGEDENAEEKKKLQVQTDIEALLDLSLYVDRVSKRMKKKLIWDLEMRIEDENGGRGVRRSNHSGNRGDDDDLDGFDPPVWQNYEQMDDIERASLLERAIMVLAEDRSEAPKGGGIDTKNRINNSSYRNR